MKQINLQHLQSIIDQTVRTLGGYWMPLSGLARVLEELGELGELILNKEYGEEFASELADVLVISICVANQYCAKLDITTSESHKPLNYSLEELYLKLAADCGEFSRIVNSYEGNKKLKSTEHPTTVEKQASTICLDIISIAEKMNLNIVETVEKTMIKVRKRDANRFDTLYDPSLSLAHDEYISETNPAYKIWGLRDSKHQNIADDLLENIDTINRFLKFGGIEAIHCLVLKLPNHEYATQDLGRYKSLLNSTIQNNFVVLTQI